jgi:hypothetical protein
MTDFSRALIEGTFENVMWFGLLIHIIAEQSITMLIFKEKE